MTAKWLKPVAVTALAGFLAACSGYKTDTAAEKISQASFSAERIKADITFLSDDMLKGRDTGSDEYRIAANYVAAEYARLGLKPAGNEGYFQQVPFQSAQLDQEGSSFSAVLDGEIVEFALGDDFYMGGSVQNPEGTATGEVVFMGYGISAPELGHDDLEGVDLTGKIALVVSGAPATFQTEVRAHHGSPSTKAVNLAEAGANGVLILTSLTDEKRRPFERYKKFIGYKSFDWVADEDAEVKPRAKASAIISADVAGKILAPAGVSVTDLLEKTEAGEAEAFPLGVEASLTRKSTLSEKVYSPNVLGVLPGSDPNLANEYVVISAHLDHVGVSKKPDGEDNIHNGALDNAAGISVMMEVARAFVNSGITPRRSLLFAAVSAEEKGLLGAEYFTNNPTVDMSNIVANVNLDMPILLYDFTDVVAFGAERSSLGPVTAAAAESIGIALSPDPMPEEGIFTRSDHYRFVQKGIPAVFLVTGFGKDTEGKDGGEIFTNFLHNIYHGVKDDVDQDINYQAGAKFAYINWLILNSIANTTERPTWNEGDFFGDTFGR